jgi:N-acetylglucosaminyldiphosphoundecaprenol N-acetyl-beta-D-mannosaminyltransferase
METENIQKASANILGVKVDAIDLAKAIILITDWIRNHEPNYVCVTPAHGIMECQRDPQLRKIFNRSGLTTPDGMAIVWLLKLWGYPHVSRVYGPDLMQAICKCSRQTGWRHFFYGGLPGVVDRLAERLQAIYPGLQVAGKYTPPFRQLTSLEDSTIVQMIQNSNADIVWVGISTPKQERWMAEHVGRVGAPVLVGVGAAFDFLAGTKKQAPRWMQHSGLEWLFRLASEPRRLWRRYLEYPRFVILAFAQLLGLKHFPID